MVNNKNFIKWERIKKNKKEDIEEEVLTNEEPTSENEESDVKEEEKEEIKPKTIEEELGEMKDKYLRLYSEFENFRRRTAKERLDLIATSTESLMLSLLPVLDDYDRASVQMEKAEDVKALKEGFDLIQTKFKQILTSKGLKEMESSVGKVFDAEVQEAITQAPAPNNKMKGKIMDEIEKGYQINDKIIRFPKVVIGQ